MRLFVAIPLPVEVLNELAAVKARMQQQVPVAKWVKTENLHLTLKFLGDVTPELVPNIVRALTLVAGQEKSFSCSLTQLGTFPSRGQPRILYVATDQRQRLTALFRRLDQRLSRLGFAQEERFVPHITIARFRPQKPSNVNLYEKQGLGCKPHLRVCGFRLIESRLGPKGSDYQTLNDFIFAS